MIDERQLPAEISADLIASNGGCPKWISSMTKLTKNDVTEKKNKKQREKKEKEKTEKERKSKEGT